MGVPLKIITNHLIGCSIVNHPFWIILGIPHFKKPPCFCHPNVFAILVHVSRLFKNRQEHVSVGQLIIFIVRITTTKDEQENTFLAGKICALGGC